MTETDDLRRELKTFTRRWEQLTAVPETPRLLMDVIEHSLGTQRKAEVYINRLFAYFLDPEQPHRMNAEFLRVFLNGLPDTCGFEEDIHDLSDVVVDDQVRLTEQVDGNTVSSGFVDLVRSSPSSIFQANGSSRSSPRFRSICPSNRNDITSSSPYSTACSRLSTMLSK